MKKPLMTPNQITVVRIVLVLFAFCLWFICPNSLVQHTSIIILFVAFILDSVDGYVAIKYDMKSNVGGFLDPVADHLSVILTVVLLIDLGLIPIWFIAPLYCRDLLVGFVRQMGQLHGKNIFASNLAKIKAEACYYLLPALYLINLIPTNAQLWLTTTCVAVLMAFIHPWIFAYDRVYKMAMYKMNAALLFAIAVCSFVGLSALASAQFVYLSVIAFIYVYSGFEYYWKNRDCIC